MTIHGDWKVKSSYQHKILVAYLKNKNIPVHPDSILLFAVLDDKQRYPRYQKR